jgi:hypothetical protein
MSNNIYLYLLVITNIICFLLGYLLSNKPKTDNTYYDLFPLNKTQRKQAEQNRIIEKVKSIDIDDRKVIIDTDTSALEKKFEILGEDKQVNESIESSINKLSQIMKGK